MIRFTRSMVIMLGLVMAFSVTVLPAESSSSRVPAVSVSIQDNFFSPKTLSISRGTKVTWVNRGQSTHTTTSDTGLWDKMLSPGQRFSRTFTQRGRFPYHCTIHPFMTGTIKVSG